MNLKLIVKAPKPQPVVFNYEELKMGLEMALAEYKDRVYDESMIAEAKTDAANLNKLKKALNDERIFRKKEYEAPFKIFEDQVKELCGMIDEATSGIKTQLDAYEQKRVDEKREAIKSLFNDIASNYDMPFITLDKIYNEKWENKSVNEKAIITEITEHFEKAKNDLEVIAQMPNFSFEAKQVYCDTLDLNKAIAEGKRMSDIAEAKKQAEALMKKATEVTPEVAEPTPASVIEPTYEFAFKCTVTKAQAVALRQFCDQNKIVLIKI